MRVIVIKPGRARLLIWNFGSVEETRAAVGGEVDIGQYSTVLGRSLQRLPIRIPEGVRNNLKRCRKHIDRRWNILSSEVTKLDP